MAEPLTYEVPREDPARNQREQAWTEFERLIVLLHEHQVLRLACDSTAALADVARILSEEFDTEDGKHALENLYVLMRILGRIPPHEFERVAEATARGIAKMEQTSTGTKPYPPGVSGTFELLRDEELWQALGPLLEGLKAFSKHLHHQRP